MKDIPQYSLGRVVGQSQKRSKLPAASPAAPTRVARGEHAIFAPRVDKLIVKAFEETREGLPLERVLADPQHATKTLRRARILGVNARDHEILMRLFRIRKSPRQNIRLSAPTVKEPRREHADYAFAAEMALSQMKYRFGASVDDILANPAIGMEFDSLCRRIHPGNTPIEYRLAALHIRKSRYCDEDEQALFDSLSEKKANATLVHCGTLDRFDAKRHEGKKGVLSLVEETHVHRYLYMTATNDLAEAVRPFQREATLQAVSNPFWSPSLALIHVYLYDIPKELQNAGASLWAKRLISLKAPLFNQPIRIAGRSAD